MLVIGHRGASAAHPENSAAAFRAAVRQGADGVELDVRRTADGGMAIWHNEALPDGRRIAALATGELPGDVLLLDGALDACRPLPVVNIEIKNWPADGDFDPAMGLADAVVARLDARGERSDGRYLVTCFHLGTVDRVRAIAPDLATGWLLGPFTDIAGLADRAAERGHKTVNPQDHFVDKAAVARAHAAGLAVYVWTVNAPDRIRELADWGVEGVITDTPDVALAALRR